MEELTMRSHAGIAFNESRYNHYGHGDEEKREVYRRCFFKGFIAGVKMYANHLYDKGSIFDIVDSIRRTAEYEEWSPLLDFEKTVLKILDKNRKDFDKTIVLEQKLRELAAWAKKEIAQRDQIIENKQKEIEELNKWLVFLKK